MKLEKDFQQPFQAWQADPNPQNTGTLLRSVQPVLDTALRTYGGAQAKSPTLRGRAKQLALEALPAYDPQRGSLRNHLLGRLQRLRRFSAGEQQVISVPEQVALQRQQLHEAERELEDKLGRLPTTAELADHTSLSAKRIAYVRQGLPPVAEGTLIRPGGEEGSGAFLPEVRSLAPQQDEWVELVYDDLGPVDQLILEHSLGLHGQQPKSAVQIAKMTRLSPGAISQRMQRIQSMLDEQEELKIF